MATAYALTWLFTAETADGRIIRQTLEDCSLLFPEITLTPVAGEVRLVTLTPTQPEYAEVAQAIAAGATEIEWEGQVCHWHRMSARADLAVDEGRGLVVEFRLTHVDTAERYVRLILGGERACELGLTPGDMLIGMPGLPQPILVPFALPESLALNGGSQGPDLRLVYGRDVTWVGVPPDMGLADVAYRIGWRVDMHGRTFEHALHLRGELG